MPLIIRTTGLEDYAPGGEARVKVLVVGGPGAGKTRWSSYFPKPLFADCEKGRASIADRNVPYVEINNSTNMQDLLALLKQECRQPRANRRFETVVIDTLDAYQRKVKDEWMQLNNSAVFTGWDAWGYLNAKMQTLMVRLLNLDMNVIVNVHFKDKTVKDDETGRESHEFMLQLQGETADNAFNDFDLVGWMGTYWESVDGTRVQKRGLTFTPKPDKPFLKDRLNVTPGWMTVDFAPTDYTKLFDAIQSKVSTLADGEVVGEVPTEEVERPAMAIAPGQIGSGPVAKTTPKEIPLNQLDKPSLLKAIRDEGVTTTVEGAPIKNNTLKSELIAALEAHRAADATPPAPEPVEPTPAAQPPADPEPAPAQPVEQQQVQPHQVNDVLVNTQTGEILDPEAEHAFSVNVVREHLGGEVVEDKVTPVAPVGTPEPSAAPPPAPAPAKPDPGVCEDCGKSLADEEPDYVKLSWIKYRKRLCETDYTKRKVGSGR